MENEYEITVLDINVGEIEKKQLNKENIYRREICIIFMKNLEGDLSD